MNFLSGTKTIPKHYSKWSGGKDKLGFLRQVKKQNKQNKAHLNKKEKEKERKKRDLGTSEVWGCLHGNYWTSYRKPQKAQQPTVPK